MNRDFSSRRHRLTQGIHQSLDSEELRTGDWRGATVAHPLEKAGDEPSHLVIAGSEGAGRRGVVDPGIAAIEPHSHRRDRGGGEVSHDLPAFRPLRWRLEEV